MGKPPDICRAARQEKKLPLLEDLRAFFETFLRRLPSKGKLAEAMRYALNRWEALIRYVDDGPCEVSNNAAERAIRPLTNGWSLCTPFLNFWKHL